MPCIFCRPEGLFIEKLKGREKEKGIKTKMRVKLAAKLLIIAWTLMKKKEPFNPELKFPVFLGGLADRGVISSKS